MRRVGFIVASVLLASCSHGGGSSPLPVTMPGAFQSAQEPFADSGYKLLYSFKSGTDAAQPEARLTQLNGTFYGTTTSGGGGYNWGTVFRVSPSGAEHVLYRFKAGKDGATPYGSLTELNGVFFGTTKYGGLHGAGTIFKVSDSGEEHVVYSFKGGTDGQYPYGGLLALNGELFGTTTSGGGGSGWGVVFKVSPAGVEHVLHRFQAGSDGGTPFAGLTLLDGKLYGTTKYGGTPGSGTVFRLNPSGFGYRVLYSFEGGTDGQYPLARLLAFQGSLYGTTYQGGVSSGWGVVFKVGTTGVEHVLYRFRATNDGAHPQYAGVIGVNGTLYGTTSQGGTGGAGTVFKVGPAGGEHVVYSFKGGSDGVYPFAGLTFLNGFLYGTTELGGASNLGTVFRLPP
ncbi:MAG: choice-of-anchor tandem repeat GloVer-containing protein [Candidatus Cybelea sp.]|jgi:uncharacterized repeat protein (TIGR03803 family)